MGGGGDAQRCYSVNFPENRMTMKKFGPGGRRVFALRNCCVEPPPFGLSKF